MPKILQLMIEPRFELMLMQLWVWGCLLSHPTVQLKLMEGGAYGGDQLEPAQKLGAVLVSKQLITLDYYSFSLRSTLLRISRDFHMFYKFKINFLKHSTLST